MVVQIILSVFKLLWALVFAVLWGLYSSVRFFIPYKMRAKDISKEIVLITGAGSGLGKLLALKMAKLGPTLVLWDIDEAAIKQTKKEIVENGGNAYEFKCDLSRKDEIYRVAREVQRSVGNITILVNNAGIVTGKKFLECDDNLIEKTFQVNTVAHFWTAKAFLPHMLERNHGHVVTVASMAGIVGASGLCDYCASKFGAVGFDEALRNELVNLNKTGVKTTVVCPYYISTGMFEGVTTNLIPFMTPDYVTDKMLEAILTDQEVLMLPRLMYLFALLQRILPVKVSSYISNDVFDTHKGMDTFKGRRKNE